MYKLLGWVRMSEENPYIQQDSLDTTLTVTRCDHGRDG